MKRVFFTTVLCLMVFFNIFSQSHTLSQSKEKRHILKTNVLIVPSIQQWTAFLENRVQDTKSDMFGISYVYMRDESSLRKSFSLSYQRLFYAKPFLDNINFFISPYSKLKFRKVYQEGSEPLSIIPISSRDFTSTSLVLGLESGFQSNISKDFTCSLNVGSGLGYVLFYEAKAFGQPETVHLDAHFLLQLGYKF